MYNRRINFTIYRLSSWNKTVRLNPHGKLKEIPTWLSETNGQLIFQSTVTSRWNFTAQYENKGKIILGMYNHSQSFTCVFHHPRATLVKSRRKPFLKRERLSHGSYSLRNLQIVYCFILRAFLLAHLE